MIIKHDNKIGIAILHASKHLYPTTTGVYYTLEILLKLLFHVNLKETWCCHCLSKNSSHLVVMVAVVLGHAAN